MDEIVFGAILALLAAAMIALALRLRAKSRAGISTSRTARTARTGVLGSKLSGRYLWAKLRARLAGTEERRKAIFDETHLKSAEDVVRFMGNMKGAIMKVGQIISFLSDDVPEQYRAILKQLQTQSPPMSFDLARQVIEEELGAPVGERFADIDPVPLASASIGQVHRARLRSGEDVVVKVQYPGVDEAIRSDLANVKWMYTLIGLFAPSLEPAPLVNEIKARIGEELDYVNEAKNQQMFADLYDGHPFIRIPKVHHAYTRPRVLTQEFVTGKGYDWLLEQDGGYRNKVAEVLYRFVFGSIFRYRAFNGDPHPGNYIFHEDGGVTFLDFGCVKYFPTQMLKDWMGLIEFHVQGEKEKFREKLIALRFIAPDSKGATDDFYDFFGYFYEPFCVDQVFTFTPEYNAKSFRMMTDWSDPRFGYLAKEFNAPPDFALLNRLQWGVYSILSQLRATGNWHRIWREHNLGEGPSTELGRASAAFRAKWRQARGIAEGAPVWLEPEGMRWE